MLPRHKMRKKQRDQIMNGHHIAAYFTEGEFKITHAVIDIDLVIVK
jgi:hypothetical protein